MGLIVIEQKFNASVEQVFKLFSQHAMYAKALSPLRIVRIKDSTDPHHPEGVGSIRSIGLGPVKLVQEQITLFKENQQIEYKLLKNPLIKHYLGRIEFNEITPNTTMVTYSIELQAKVPLLGELILARLETAFKLGLSKLARSMV